MVSFLGNTQSKWEQKDIELDLRIVQDNSTTPYVKITSLENGNSISIHREDSRANSITTSFEYSMDGKNWKSYSVESEIQLNYNQSVYFRNGHGTALGFVHTWSWSNDAPSIISYHKFISTKKFNVSGNVMALINYKNLGMNLPSYGLCELFAGCKYLVDASNLKLPQAIGSDSMCYMFSGCSSLQRAPILQFTSLYQFSLWNMFSNNSVLPYLIWDSSVTFPKSTVSSYVNETSSGVVFYTKSNFDVEASKTNLPLGIQVNWSFVSAIDTIPNIKEMKMAQAEMFISNRFNLPDWMEVSR